MGDNVELLSPSNFCDPDHDIIFQPSRTLRDLVPPNQPFPEPMHWRDIYKGMCETEGHAVLAAKRAVSECGVAS